MTQSNVITLTTHITQLSIHSISDRDNYGLHTHNGRQKKSRADGKVASSEGRKKSEGRREKAKVDKRVSGCGCVRESAGGDSNQPQIESFPRLFFVQIPLPVEKWMSVSRLFDLLTPLLFQPTPKHDTIVQNIKTKRLETIATERKIKKSRGLLFSDIFSLSVCLSVSIVDCLSCCLSLALTLPSRPSCLYLVGHQNPILACLPTCITYSCPHPHALDFLGCASGQCWPFLGLACPPLVF